MLPSWHADTDGLVLCPMISVSLEVEVAHLSHCVTRRVKLFFGLQAVLYAALLWEMVEDFFLF